MTWLVIILGGSTIFLLSYLYFVKKEIKNISNQLNEYNESKTRKKIDVRLIDKNVEKLAESINKHIDISNEMELNQIKAQDELKSLIASISHDLRTPLTSILGYLQMLNSKNITEEKKEQYFNVVEKRSKQLHGLVDEFFTLSVIESKEYKLKLESINIKEVLIDIAMSYYEQFNNSGIEVDLDIKEEEFKVLGDVSASKRVIENLMINILRHARGRVKIKLEKVSDNVVMTVINHANYITNSDAEILFNKFYKGDKSRGLDKSSTGLGLAIVKELMIKMNGSIKAEVNSGLLYIHCSWKEV